MRLTRVEDEGDSTDGGKAVFGDIFLTHIGGLVHAFIFVFIVHCNKIISIDKLNTAAK